VFDLSKSNPVIVGSDPAHNVRDELYELAVWDKVSTKADGCLNQMVSDNEELGVF
jgi:hypothetical protein